MDVVGNSIQSLIYTPSTIPSVSIPHFSGLPAVGGVFGHRGSGEWVEVFLKSTRSSWSPSGGMAELAVRGVGVENNCWNDQMMGYWGLEGLWVMVESVCE